MDVYAVSVDGNKSATENNETGTSDIIMNMDVKKVGTCTETSAHGKS